jgi:hypothetical protein
MPCHAPRPSDGARWWARTGGADARPRATARDGEPREPRLRALLFVVRRADCARCGGPLRRYHIFHRDDLKRIAPLWLKYCGRVRMEPERYWSINGSIPANIPTGDAYVKFGNVRAHAQQPASHPSVVQWLAWLSGALHRCVVLAPHRCLALPRASTVAW